MLVAISGGIGSGKSIIARILSTMGYPVYDCDSNARYLINNSTEIKTEIKELIGENCILPDGTLNRKVVGDVVFNDSEKLRALNKITHSAVRADIAKWEKTRGEKLMFVETAILYHSEIDKMVDAVIEVVAPTEIRIKRIQKRNGLNRNEIINRINSQQFDVEEPHARIFTIENDGNSAIIPQLLSILANLGY